MLQCCQNLIKLCCWKQGLPFWNLHLHCKVIMSCCPLTRNFFCRADTHSSSKAYRLPSFRKKMWPRLWYLWWKPLPGSSCNEFQIHSTNQDMWNTRPIHNSYIMESLQIWQRHCLLFPEKVSTPHHCPARDLTPSCDKQSPGPLYTPSKPQVSAVRVVWDPKWCVKMLSGLYLAVILAGSCTAQMTVCSIP